MFKSDFVIVDLETTGLSPTKNEIIEIGAIKVKDNIVIDKMDIFVKPEIPVPYYITKITGITNDMLKNAMDIRQALRKFDEFREDYTLVAHNAKFDMGFLNNYYNICFNKTINDECLDTLAMSRNIVNDISDYKLGTLANYFNVDYRGAHRSLKDCEITLGVYNGLKDMYMSNN